MTHRSPGDKRRLEALESYDILDTPREPEFDQVTELLTVTCDVPIALINLVAENRQWFKSERGLGIRQTDLGSSICAEALLQENLFVVPDTTEDPRFADNPLVTGPPRLRFYAGALLESPDGYPLGTVCILDTEPRQLTTQQERCLEILADHVMHLLELRRMLSGQVRMIAQLADHLEEYEELHAMVSHDMRSPLTSISLAAQHLQLHSEDETTREMGERLFRATQRMNKLIEELLDSAHGSRPRH